MIDRGARRKGKRGVLIKKNSLLDVTDGERNRGDLDTTRNRANKGQKQTTR